MTAYILFIFTVTARNVPFLQRRQSFDTAMDLFTVWVILNIYELHIAGSWLQSIR